MDLAMKFSRSFLTGLALLVAGGLSGHAVPLTRAEITVVQNDVSLINASGSSKPAAVKDVVVSNNSVSTGKGSRAELQFNDKSIIRLGQNSAFSFKPGTRQIDLQKGSLLFNVTKGQGRTEIKTAAVTAAIVGTTGIMQTGPGFFALYVYEGAVNVGGKLITAGMALIIRNGVEQIVPFDVLKAMKTSALFNNFPSLPSEDDINKAAEQAGFPDKPDPSIFNRKDENILNPDIPDREDNSPPVFYSS
jgi:hypothetical protein